MKGPIDLNSASAQGAMTAAALVPPRDPDQQPPPPVASVSTPHNSDIRIDFKKIKSEGITHLFPILSGLCIAGKESDNPSVRELVHEMRADGQRVATFPLEWRGKSKEELEAALSPMLTHYRIQALLLCERTRRRVVENEQLTTWSNLHVALQYTTPLKHKLMAHWAKTVLGRQLEEIDSGQGPEDRLHRLHSSQVNSESGFPHADKAPESDSGEGMRNQTAFVNRMQQQLHGHPQAPPMMANRRGSLAARRQSQTANGNQAGDGQASLKSVQPPRALTLAEAQDSAANFEKTLTQLLENPRSGGGGRRKRNQPNPTNLPPLNLPKGLANAGADGGTVAALFASALSTASEKGKDNS